MFSYNTIHMRQKDNSWLDKTGMDTYCMKRQTLNAQDVKMNVLFEAAEAKRLLIPL